MAANKSILTPLKLGVHPQVRRDRPHGRKYGHEQAEQAQKRAAGRDVDRGFPPEAKFRRRSARAVLELLVRA